MFSSDIIMAKEQLTREIVKLHSREVKPSLDVRKQEVDKLIEEYFSATGSRPDADALRRLGDYLLIDLITDQQKHHRGDEYPFHSKKQSKRRNSKQVPETWAEEREVI